ncbi:hypothetical protein BBP40_002927 [Aspergillus hancockii]|nr:hypothetical protein BBP40_002927 [Aspergillus hancockii]
MRPITRSLLPPRFCRPARTTSTTRVPLARYNHAQATRDRTRDSHGRNSAQWALGGLVTGAGGYALVSQLQSSKSHETHSTDNAKAVEYADKQAMLKGIQLIQKTLGEDSVSWDDEDILLHGYSELSTSNCQARPVAVVRPKIPFAGGSSVEGHFVAPYSGLSIDFSGMNKVISFHPDDMDVVVQPGVNWVDLNNQLKDSGLFLPLDPSPTALIGGMVATNCSGTNAVRYGTMKDWVVNLTVILADGTVIKTRHRPRKTSAGYNLTSLFTGSEGTLGMITEITLKLATIPENQSVATVTFPSIREAAAAASNVMRLGIQVAALEMMDETQMQVINKNGGAGGRLWTEKPTLLFKYIFHKP